MTREELHESETRVMRAKLVREKIEALRSIGRILEDTTSRDGSLMSAIDERWPAGNAWTYEQRKEMIRGWITCKATEEMNRLERDFKDL